MPMGCVAVPGVPLPPWIRGTVAHHWTAGLTAAAHCCSGARLHRPAGPPTTSTGTEQSNDTARPAHQRHLPAQSRVTVSSCCTESLSKISTRTHAQPGYYSLLTEALGEQIICEVRC